MMMDIALGLGWRLQIVIGIIDQIRTSCHPTYHEGPFQFINPEVLLRVLEIMLLKAMLLFKKVIVQKRNEI